MSELQKVDPEIARAIDDEFVRQNETLILIASENTASKAVLEAQGSLMTYKYAEGYPGKRYYRGCEHVDVAENLAIERAKKLSTPTMPMYSRTQVRRLIWRFTTPSWRSGRLFSG